jgi:hypothetical protein
MEIEGDTQQLKPVAPRTPADALARQVELLEAIRELLDRQQRVVLHLAQQQNTQAEQLSRMDEWVSHTGKALFPDAEAHPGRQWVKVQDVNIPFFNLAGFLVKVALASIPAGLILGMIWFFIVALFGLLGLSLSLFGL